MPGVTFLEHGNIEAATQLIQRRNIAAMFVETIQGEVGIRVWVNLAFLVSQAGGQIWSGEFPR